MSAALGPTHGEHGDAQSQGRERAQQPGEQRQRAGDGGLSLHQRHRGPECGRHAEAEGDPAGEEVEDRSGRDEGGGGPRVGAAPGEHATRRTRQQRSGDAGERHSQQVHERAADDAVGRQVHPAVPP